MCLFENDLAILHVNVFCTQSIVPAKSVMNLPQVKDEEVRATIKSQKSKGAVLEGLIEYDPSVMVIRRRYVRESKRDK